MQENLGRERVTVGLLGIQEEEIEVFLEEIRPEGGLEIEIQKEEEMELEMKEDIEIIIKIMGQLYY